MVLGAVETPQDATTILSGCWPSGRLRWQATKTNRRAGPIRLTGRRMSALRAGVGAGGPSPTLGRVSLAPVVVGALETPRRPAPG